MFSGKTTEIITHIKLIKVIDIKYIIIKPKIDIRYESEKIVSHDNQKENCIIIEDLDTITDDIINDYIYIIIDEAQFIKNLKNKVLYWIEKLNKNVIIAGLNCDFQRNPIGEIIDLIPYADICNIKTSLCKICNDGTTALFSHRKCNKNKEQILIGSNDLYIPVCRTHYLELN
jgi:thymidine kinase